MQFHQLRGERSQWMLTEVGGKVTDTQFFMLWSREKTGEAFAVRCQSGESVGYPVFAATPLFAGGSARQRQESKGRYLRGRFFPYQPADFCDFSFQILPIADVLALMQQMQSRMMQARVEP